MLVKWSKREPVIQMILGIQKVEALLTEWVWKSLNSCIQPWREDDPEEDEPPPFSIDEDEVVIADSQIHSFPFDSDLFTYRSKPKPPEQTISLAGTFTNFELSQRRKKQTKSNNLITPEISNLGTYKQSSSRDADSLLRFFCCSRI